MKSVNIKSFDLYWHIIISFFSIDRIHEVWMSGR